MEENQTPKKYFDKINYSSLILQAIGFVDIALNHGQDATRELLLLHSKLLPEIREALAPHLRILRAQETRTMSKIPQIGVIQTGITKHTNSLVAAHNAKNNLRPESLFTDAMRQYAETCKKENITPKATSLTHMIPFDMAPVTKSGDLRYLAYVLFVCFELELVISELHKHDLLLDNQRTIEVGGY